MHRYLICCAALLAGCGPSGRVAIPPELLAPCVGYQGPSPQTEGQFVNALLTDRAALGKCNAQITAIGGLQ